MNNTLSYLTARAAQLPADEDARITRLTASGGDRFGVIFNDNETQELIWTIPQIPDCYQGTGTLFLDIHCAMDSATSNTAGFNVYLEAGDVNISATSFDSVNTDGETVPGIAGDMFIITVTLSNIDSMSAGDVVRIKLNRNLTTYTATGDLYVLGALLYETVSSVTLDGSVVASTFTSNVSTGTAPFVVSSSTVVTNLNADLLDGLNSSAFPILTPTSSSRNVIQPSAATYIPITVKGYASQSANLQEWQNNSSTVLASVSSDGLVSGLSFTSTQTTGTAPFVVASTTVVTNLNADLLDGLNSSAFVQVSDTTYVSISPTSSSRNVIQPSAATYIPLIVKGYASQSANLQEWQASDGDIRAYVNYNGDFTCNRSITADQYSGFHCGTMEMYAASIRKGGGDTGNRVSIIGVETTAYSAATIPLVVKGASSQSANLTEWQNSSGTVLLNIDKDGKLKWSSSVYLYESGGYLYLNSASGFLFNQAPSVPGLSITPGHIYISDTVVGLGDTTSIGFTSDYYGSATKDAGISRNSAGILQVTNGSSGLGSLIVGAYSAATIGLTIKGAVSQSANLTEWQNSAGTTLAYIAPGEVFSGYDNTHFAIKQGSYAYKIGTYAAGGAFVFYRDSANYNMQLSFKSTGIGLGVNTGGQLHLSGSSASEAMTITPEGAGASGAILAIGKRQTDGHALVGCMTEFWPRTGQTNPVITTVVPGGASQVFKVKIDGDIYTTLQSASVVGLTIKSASSQSANLQEWQNSDGTVLAKIASNGQISSTQAVGTDLIADYYSNRVYLWLNKDSTHAAVFEGLQTDRTTLSIKPASGQTANLQEWQNSSSTVLSHVNSSGEIVGSVKLIARQSGGVAGTDEIQISHSGTAGLIACKDGALNIESSGATRISLTDTLGIDANIADISTGGGSLFINKAGTAMYVMPTFELDWRASASGSFDTGLTRSAAGILKITDGSTGLGSLIIGAYSAATVGLTVKGYASQTAKLQEWQDSSSTVKAAVTKDGFINVGGTTVGTHVLLKCTAGAQFEVRHADDSNPCNVFFGGGVFVNTTSAGLQLGSTWQLHFCSGTNPTSTGQDSGIGRSAAGIIKITDGSSGLGSLICGAYSASTIGLTVKGYTSQSANLQEWQNSAGTVLGYVNSAGSLHITTASSGSVGTPTFKITETGVSSILRYYGGTLELNTVTAYWADAGGLNRIQISSALSGMKLDVYHKIYFGNTYLNEDLNIALTKGNHGIFAITDNSAKKGSIVCGSYGGSTPAQTITGTTNANKLITNVALTSNVATITTSGPHTFQTGQTIVISGLTNSGLNGTYTITNIPSTTTFKYDKTASNIASVADSGYATQTQSANLTQWLVTGGGARFIAASSQVLSYGTASLNADADMTISMWINPIAASTGDLFFVGTTNVFDGFRIYFDSTNNRINVNRTTTTNYCTSASSSIPSGCWTHVVVTYVASTGLTQIYINGVASGLSGSNTVSVGTKGYKLGYSGSAYYNGNMDAVGIWNKVLTTSDISSLFTLNKSYTELNSSELTSLHAWYDFASSGTLLTDSSGNSRTLTNTGTVTADEGIPNITTKVTASGGLSITTANSTEVPLKTYTGTTTNNLIESYNNSTSKRFWVDNYGSVNTGVDGTLSMYVGYNGDINSFNSTLRLYSTSSIVSRKKLEIGTTGETAASDIVLTVKGAASQTANLTEWQNSSGTVLSKIAADGGPTFFANGVASDSTLMLGTLTTSTWMRFIPDSSSGTAFIHSDNPTALRIIATGSNGNVAKPIYLDGSTTSVRPSTASDIGLIVKGASSQTANLQEWQDSSATVLSSVTKDGFIKVNGTTTSTAPLTVKSTDTNIAIFETTGNGGVRINTTVSGGNPFLQFDRQNTGKFWVQLTTSTNNLDFYNANNVNVFRIGQSGSAFYADASTTIGLTIKGATSQSANLQEWQDSSAAILAKLSSGGAFSVHGTSSLDYTTTTAGLYLGYQGSVAPTILFANGTAAQNIRIDQVSGSLRGTIAGTALFSMDASTCLFTTSYLKSTNNVQALGNLSAQKTASATYNALQSTAQLYLDGFNGGGYGGTATADGYGIWDTARMTDDGGTVRTAHSNEYYVTTAAAASWKARVVKKVGDLTAQREYLRAESNGTYALTSIGGAAVIASTALAVVSPVSTYVGLTVKGATSQSANLIEVQNSSSTVKWAVNNDGSVTQAGGILITGATSGININNGTIGMSYSGCFTTSALAMGNHGSLTYTLRVGTNYGGTFAGNASILCGSSAGHRVGLIVQKISDKTKTINNVELTSNVATLTTSAAHGFVVGESVLVSGLTNSGLNGTYTITVVGSTTTFSYAKTASNIASVADSGTAVVSQSASIQEWQNDAGTAVLKIQTKTTAGETDRPVITWGSTSSVLGLSFQTPAGTEVIRLQDNSAVYFPSGAEIGGLAIGGYYIQRGYAGKISLGDQGAGDPCIDILNVSGGAYAKHVQISNSSAASIALVVKARTTRSKTINNVALTSNVATITTTTTHGFVAGESVVVSGLTNSGLNGTYVIVAAPTTYTFTYAKTASDIVSVADSGTAIVAQAANLTEWQDSSATVLAKVNKNGVITGRTRQTFTSSSNASTYDYDVSRTQSIVLTESTTLTVSNPVDGHAALLMIEQGGSGSYTVTWPANFLWSGGTAPTLTTTVGKVDLITFVYHSSNDKYYASATTNF